MSYRFAQKLLDEQKEELDLFASLIDKYNLSEGKPNSDKLFDNSVDHPAIEEEPWLEDAEKED
jgi:ferritin